MAKKETTFDEEKNEKQEELEVVAVIVTICEGSTYDPIFTSVKQ